jgi:hypothetical protein
MTTASVAAEVAVKADAGAWEASNTSPSSSSAAGTLEPEHIAVEEPGGVGAAGMGVDVRAISTPTLLLQVGWKRPELGPAARHAEEMARL